MFYFALLIPFAFFCERLLFGFADIKKHIAAVSLGISSMKKRKLRTFLTTTTLVLLMFTVLSFTSVASYTSYFKIPVMQQAPYSGLLLKDRRWRDINTNFIDYAVDAFTPCQINGILRM